MALGSGGDFKGFWTSGGLGRRILKDSLLWELPGQGQSWPGLGAPAVVILLTLLILLIRLTL